MARRTVNEVELIGFVGEDARLAFSQDGEARANFSLATHRQWKDAASGEMKQATDWHPLVAFGKYAQEVVAKLARSGAYLRLKGSLRYRTVAGDDGKKRYYTDIVVTDLIALDKPDGLREEAPKPQDAPEPPPEE